MNQQESLSYNQHTVVILILFAIGFILVISGLVLIMSRKIDEWYDTFAQRRRDRNIFKVAERGRNDFR